MAVQPNFCGNYPFHQQVFQWAAKSIFLRFCINKTFWSLPMRNELLKLQAPCHSLPKSKKHAKPKVIMLVARTR